MNNLKKAISKKIPFKVNAKSEYHFVICSLLHIEFYDSERIFYWYNKERYGYFPIVMDYKLNINMKSLEEYKDHPAIEYFPETDTFSENLASFLLRRS